MVSAEDLNLDIVKVAKIALKRYQEEGKIDILRDALDKISHRSDKEFDALVEVMALDYNKDLFYKIEKKQKKLRKMLKKAQGKLKKGKITKARNFLIKILRYAEQSEDDYLNFFQKTAKTLSRWKKATKKEATPGRIFWAKTAALGYALHWTRSQIDHPARELGAELDRAWAIVDNTGDVVLELGHTTIESVTTLYELAQNKWDNLLNWLKGEESKAFDPAKLEELKEQLEELKKEVGEYELVSEKREIKPMSHELGPPSSGFAQDWVAWLIYMLFLGVYVGGEGLFVWQYFKKRKAYHIAQARKKEAEALRKKRKAEIEKAAELERKAELQMQEERKMIEELLGPELAEKFQKTTKAEIAKLLVGIRNKVNEQAKDMKQLNDTNQSLSKKLELMANEKRKQLEEWIEKSDKELQSKVAEIVFHTLKEINADPKDAEERFHNMAAKIDRLVSDWNSRYNERTREYLIWAEGKKKVGEKLIEQLRDSISEFEQELVSLGKQLIDKINIEDEEIIHRLNDQLDSILSQVLDKEKLTKLHSIE